MDSPVPRKTDPSDAAAITIIFENATRYTLTDIQREYAEKIILELPRNASVMDFVSIAQQRQELKEFALVVRDHFVSGHSSNKP